MEKKFFPRPMQRLGGRKVVGEMDGCWREMADSLTGGKILDLFDNLNMLSSKLYRVFRKCVGVFYLTLFLDDYLVSCSYMKPFFHFGTAKTLFNTFYATYISILT
jgi:hypothetical protein